MKGDNKVQGLPVHAEFGSSMKAKQASKTSGLQRQLDAWYNEQQVTIVKIQRAQEKAYRALLRVNKEKQRLHLQQKKHLKDKGVNEDGLKQAKKVDGPVVKITMYADGELQPEPMLSSEYAQISGATKEHAMEKRYSNENSTSSNSKATTQELRKKYDEHKNLFDLAVTSGDNDVNDLKNSRPGASNKNAGKRVEGYGKVNEIPVLGDEKAEDWLRQHVKGVTESPSVPENPYHQKNAGGPSSKKMAEHANNFTNHNNDYNKSSDSTAEQSTEKMIILPNIKPDRSMDNTIMNNHKEREMKSKVLEVTRQSLAGLIVRERSSLKSAGDAIYISTKCSKEPTDEGRTRELVSDRDSRKRSQDCVTPMPVIAEDGMFSQSRTLTRKNQAKRDDAQTYYVHKSPREEVEELTKSGPRNEKNQQDNSPKTEISLGASPSHSKSPRSGISDSFSVKSPGTSLPPVVPPTSKSWHAQSSARSTLPDIRRVSDPRSLRVALKHRRQAEERMRREILDKENFNTYHRLADGTFQADIVPFKRKEFLLPSHREDRIRQRMMAAQSQAEETQRAKMASFFKQLEEQKAKEREAAVWNPPPKTKKKKKRYAVDKKLQNYAAVYQQNLDIPEGVDPDSFEAIAHCRYIRTPDPQLQHDNGSELTRNYKQSTLAV